MSRVLLCTGAHASTPYYFTSLGLRVWSAEEMCYCFFENAFLLEQDIVSKDLIAWIQEELQLPDLAESLRGFVRQPGSMSPFVITILRYVGFYSEEEIDAISKTLVVGASADDYEKKKSRADFLAGSKHYVKALVEYERLLKELPENEIRIRVTILNNIGTVLAGLFLFKDAADSFLEAYRFSGEEEDLNNYLAAMRMALTDEEYVKFIADSQDTYALSIDLEKRMNEVLDAWEVSETYEELQEMEKRKAQGESGGYYSEIYSLIQKLKEDYREYTEI